MLKKLFIEQTEVKLPLICWLGIGALVLKGIF